MNNEELAQTAKELRDTINFTKSEIGKNLSRLADTLTLYGFVLDNCDVYVIQDKTHGGDIHYRFDVQITVATK